MSYVRSCWRPKDYSANPTWPVPCYYVADTLTDLPATTEGDLAYVKDTDKLYKRAQSAWVEVAGGAGGGAAWGDITGTLSAQADLQSALDSKAATGHGHVIADVTSLQTSLDGKAATAHTHIISNVTGLQAALDGKSDVGHVHSGLPVRVVKAADQANSTTTLANVTDLAFSVAASTQYTFRFVVYFTAAATTTGLCLAVNGPASPTFLRIAHMIPTSATAWTQNVVTVYETQLVAANSAGATALCAIVEGYLSNGVNAGTLTLRFRSEVAASAVTILRGSSGILT